MWLELFASLCFVSTASVCKERTHSYDFCMGYNSYPLPVRSIWAITSKNTIILCSLRCNCVNLYYTQGLQPCCKWKQWHKWRNLIWKTNHTYYKCCLFPVRPNWSATSKNKGSKLPHYMFSWKAVLSNGKNDESRHQLCSSGDAHQTCSTSLHASSLVTSHLTCAIVNFGTSFWDALESRRSLQKSFVIKGLVWYHLYSISCIHFRYTSFCFVKCWMCYLEHIDKLLIPTKFKINRKSSSGSTGSTKCLHAATTAECPKP